jgi:hypothetical protein
LELATYNRQTEPWRQARLDSTGVIAMEHMIQLHIEKLPEGL